MSELGSYVIVAAGSISASTISISAISIINLGLLLWLSTREPRTPEQDCALRSHGLWSGMWLAWLLAWAVSRFSRFGAVALEDIGAYLLIGSAVVRLWGMPGLRRYARVGYLLLIFTDFVWPIAILYEWNHASAPANSDVFLNTLLFAPSLCLVVFALGLVGWVLLHLATNPLLRLTAALAAGGYALFQVLIYQVNLFDPSLPIGNSPRWAALMVIWRAFFVLVFWTELMDSVGVTIPAGPVRNFASKLGWLPPVIVTALVTHYWK